MHTFGAGVGFKSSFKSFAFMVSIGDVDRFTLLFPLWVVVGWKVIYGFVVGG